MTQPFLRLVTSTMSLMALLALSACQSSSAYARHEPWQTTQAGRLSLGGSLALGSGYEVDSVVAIGDSNFGEPASVSGVMEGKFGAALSAEYFVVDDLSLFVGGELRVFEPDLGEDLIRFGSIDQFELFLGSRWFLPTRWLKSQRLRPFVHTKLAYIPAVTFDMTTTIPIPPPLNDAVLLSPYRGSSYWSLGAGGGLAYELTENWIARLEFYYEWALAESTASGVPTTLQGSTGNQFVDDIMNSLEYDISIEPQGWLGFASIGYSF
jgi:hypothetical protein